MSIFLMVSKVFLFFLPRILINKFFFLKDLKIRIAFRDEKKDLHLVFVFSTIKMIEILKPARVDCILENRVTFCLLQV